LRRPICGRCHVCTTSHKFVLSPLSNCAELLLPFRSDCLVS
jgi:hypothetical protein